MPVQLPASRGKVVPLAGAGEPGPTLAMAAETFLARPQLDRDTGRSYAQTLTRLRREFGDDAGLAALTAEQVLEVFTAAWATAAARTWNRHRSAVRSFAAWANGRGFLTEDLGALLERRPETQDRTKAINRHRMALKLLCLVKQLVGPRCRAGRSVRGV
jgi:site-specific recombinase XerD